MSSFDNRWADTRVDVQLVIASFISMVWATLLSVYLFVLYARTDTTQSESKRGATVSESLPSTICNDRKSRGGPRFRECGYGDHAAGVVSVTCCGRDEPMH